MKTYHQLLNPHICSCNLAIKSNVLRHLPFLRQATNNSMEALRLYTRNYALTQGQELNTAHTETGIFGVVVKGALKIFRFVDNRQYIILDIVGQGDFFLFNNADTSRHQMYGYPDIIQSLTTSCVLTTEKSRLDQVLSKDPRIALDFVNTLSERMSAMNERFIQFASGNAEQRVGHLLCYLLGKGPAPDDHNGLIPFNLTRKDLAALAGITLETASRILVQLERDGLIKSGRGWIEIVDQKLLERSYHHKSMIS